MPILLLAIACLVLFICFGRKLGSGTTEVDIMRHQLMEHFTKQARNGSQNAYHNFFSGALDGLQNGRRCTDAEVSNAMEHVKAVTEEAIQQLGAIPNMSDAEVRELYYRIFGREHPEGYG